MPTYVYTVQLYEYSTVLFHKEKCYSKTKHSSGFLRIYVLGTFFVNTHVLAWATKYSINIIWRFSLELQYVKQNKKYCQCDWNIF
jgi:hypothetical protein